MTENIFSRQEPGNKADRARFAGLSATAQDAVRDRVAELYDGSRTVAQCWKLALDEADQTAAKPAEWFDASVIADNAPTGVLLWPVRSERYAPNFTLSRVDAEFGSNGQPYVKWTYESGREQVFRKGESVAVRLSKH